ncbi:MAG: protein kinase [Planctomycetes bacterium]|nr:protein kinase [Planctomycetota bacterium]
MPPAFADAVSTLNEVVPQFFSELIIQRMLAKRPQERFQTPAEAAAALEPLVKAECGVFDVSPLAIRIEEGYPVQDAEPPSLTPREQEPKVRHAHAAEIPASERPESRWNWRWNWPSRLGRRRAESTKPSGSPENDDEGLGSVKAGTQAAGVNVFESDQTATGSHGRDLSGWGLLILYLWAAITLFGLVVWRIGEHSPSIHVVLTTLQRITSSGELVGDLAYMAPERTEPDGVVDCRSDIYSLGACLYALLAGRPPFTGRGTVHLIEMIRNESPVPPSRIYLSVPGPLEGIVLKCLAKSPTDRFQSPMELREELARVAQYQGMWT